MKIRFLLLFAILLFNHFTTTAQNTLTVNDPQWWSSNEPGSIQEATITVEPKGLYTEVGMYLTFSAANLWYNLEDTLEVVLDFTLPTDAIVNDSWLWVNQDIVRGEVIDRWTASDIFEEFVDRRTDPSILFKNGVDKYQLRVFPMAGTETRKVKLNFLIPTRWTNEHVFVDLPFNILNTSYSPIENFKLLVRANEEWGDPQITNPNSVSFVEVAEPGLGNWQQAVLSSAPQNLSLQFDAPLENGVYVSTYEQGGEKIYQTAFIPSEFVDVNESKKVMVLLDYHLATTNLSKTALLNQVKSQLYEQLDSTDFFNIATHNSIPVLQSETWLPANSMNIEGAFANISNVMASTGNTSELLFAGINFIQDHQGEGQLLLIASGEQVGFSDAADDLIELTESKMEGTIIPIHIIDFQDKNFNWYWAENDNGYYRGNDYFYIHLSRLTNSTYYRWFETGFTVDYNMNLVFQKLKQIDWSYDFYTTLENGFCYDRYQVTFDGQSTYLNQPILQVGKYVGDFPFKLALSAIVNDTTFVHEEVEIAESSIYTADSLAHETWVGHFLKELESSGTSNNIVNQIINESIDERVLSLYTAYLCLEPGEGGETCAECYNDDGEGGEVVIFTTETVPEQKFSLKAFPNPFSSQTTLQIDLKQEILKEDVQVEVYNILGHRIKTLPVHSYDIKNQQLQLPWDAHNEDGQVVESGTYFFVVRIGEITKVVKVMFFRV